MTARRFEGVAHELVAACGLGPGQRALDVAAGTGNVALAIAASGASPEACDLSPALVAKGKQRCDGLGEWEIPWVVADAEQLPFSGGRYDAVLSVFGLVFAPRPDVAIAEAFRVLRIGGHFVCLEFSAVDVPGLDRLYDLYSFNAIPALGRFVAGDEEAYRYLVESIRRFPRPDVFAGMIRAAGFHRVSHRMMTGGIVALHSGWRL